MLGRIVGVTFSLPDGSVGHRPATAAQPSYEVEVRDGAIKARRG